MANTLNGTQSTKRIPSIDRFRGTVIFCMIVFQFIAGFPNLGAISHISSHAPKETAIYILPNLAIADVVAPMFILAMALHISRRSAGVRSAAAPRLQCSTSSADTSRLSASVCA